MTHVFSKHMFCFYFLLSLSAIAALIVFLTSLNSYYWYDDFWIILEIKERGFFGNSIWFYNNWDGRSFSPIYFFRNLLLVLIPYEFAFIPSFLSISSIFITAIIIVKVISNKLSSKFHFVQKHIIVILVFLGLWISFSAHLSRSVYWVTGSFYSYTNLFLLISIYFILFRPLRLIFNLILITITCLSGVNLALILSFLVFLILLKEKDKKIKSVLLWYLILSIIFLFVVLLAPGNFVRGDGKFDFSIYSILSVYFGVILEFLFMSKWIFISSFLVSIVVSFLSNNVTINSLWMSVVFLICALVYLLPFSTVLDSASKHTAIHFQTLIWLSSFFAYFDIIKKIKISINMIFGLLFLFISFLIYRSVEQYFIGREMKSKIDKRYLYFENMSGKGIDVVIPPILNDPNNYTNRLGDLTFDSEHENNQSYSRFFNLNSVRVIEKD